MPMLATAELAKVTPRWPMNGYNIFAPDWCCGDYDCECADEARLIMTDGEYQLAFGVPKEFGLDEEELAAFSGGTTVAVTEGWSAPPYPPAAHQRLQ